VLAELFRSELRALWYDNGKCFEGKRRLTKHLKLESISQGLNGWIND
jgi:hypothetical protein